MLAAKKNPKIIKWQIYGTDDAIPTLVMDINPKELSISYKKIINRTRTYGGFIEEHWGDDIDALTGSGKTAMFFSGDGLTVENRRQSEALNTFLDLLGIYQNNGAQTDNNNRIVKVGRVRMDFDNKLYDGFFESFTFNELAEEPFVLSYDFSFKILRSYGEYQVARSVTTSQFLNGLGT